MDQDDLVLGDAGRLAPAAARHAGRWPPPPLPWHNGTCRPSAYRSGLARGGRRGYPRCGRCGACTRRIGSRSCARSKRPRPVPNRHRSAASRYRENTCLSFRQSAHFQNSTRHVQVLQLLQEGTLLGAQDQGREAIPVESFQQVQQLSLCAVDRTRRGSNTGSCGFRWTSFLSRVISTDPSDTVQGFDRHWRHRMIEKIARKANLLRYSLRASRSLQATLVATLRRAWRCIARRRFLAEEAFAAGLLELDCDPGIARSRREPAIPGAGPEENQSCSWSPLLADKGIFYRFCETEGLPIPDLYAIYFRQTPGYCRQGTPLYDPQQWTRFLTTTSSAGVRCQTL